MTKTLRIEVTPAMREAGLRAYSPDISEGDYIEAALTAAFQHPEFLAQIVPEWLPIESAPKDGTIILLASGEQMVSARWRDSIPERKSVIGEYTFWFTETPAMWEVVDGRAMTVVEPTHWQPLPEPPRANLAGLLGVEK
jgi:hypothetical protein